MESQETKIKRLLKTAGIFNWAKQNKPRYDDTLAEVRKIVDDPPRQSLAPINRLCKKLANRELTYDEALAAAAGYEGYLRMAADEILPALDHYLTSKQVEVAPNFVEEPYRYPFARISDGTVRSIPIDPTYVSIERDKLVPTFVLGWTRPNFSFYQVQLISSILADDLLTRQDFVGSDGTVILLRRGKWENAREAEVWRLSHYATLDREQLRKQFNLYNRAVAQVLAELQNE